VGRLSAHLSHDAAHRPHVDGCAEVRLLPDNLRGSVPNRLDLKGIDPLKRRGLANIGSTPACPNTKFQFP
jgi:hypothetical protein